jgi:acyl carrier protein
MTTSPIASELIAFIQGEFVSDPGTTVTETMPLISAGVIDSFSFVALQRFIQKRFGAAIPDACINADQFDTVAQMVALIGEFKAGV